MDSCRCFDISFNISNTMLCEYCVNKLNISTKIQLIPNNSSTYLDNIPTNTASHLKNYVNLMDDEDNRNTLINNEEQTKFRYEPGYRVDDTDEMQQFIKYNEKEIPDSLWSRITSVIMPSYQLVDTKAKK
ncbi:hypothetical protein PPL_02384 [Heterostelium album PN500]|uniref:Uncharacterized protein n=1 Tax=Heterostelium pallidum (strain ATCC 26659 / Pp 5 / PN500) TaxID=670386 RepID=D3AZK2_HETP5|nr:hypothetical protein PPL_02384 [Heterostelium album PN500]EFA85381.1 hypothetical protein PPL_02384 [Heterostelium album PN500]|eukprot:XP_020437490.1 hypothetical protein PPL_02384 [Heterostelium album PN500]